MAVSFERTKPVLDFVRDNWEIMPERTWRRNWGAVLHS